MADVSVSTESNVQSDNIQPEVSLKDDPENPLAKAFDEPKQEKPGKQKHLRLSPAEQALNDWQGKNKQGEKEQPQKAKRLVDVKSLDESEVKPQEETDSDNEKLLSMFNTLAEEEGIVEKKPEENVGDADMEEDLKDLDPNSRAAQRIRTLAAREKEKAVELQKAQEVAWQYHNALQEEKGRIQKENSQYREQIAALNAKFDTFSQMQQRQQQPELDPAEKLEQEWLKKLSGEMEKKVAPLQQKYQQMESFFKKQMEDAKLRNIQAQTEQQAMQALNSTVFKNFAPEAAEKLSPQVKTLVYALALQNNISIPEAAQQFRKIGVQYGMEIVKGNLRGNKDQMNSSGAVPKPVPQGMNSPSNSVDPDQDTLNYNGYTGINGLARWDMEGRRPLKPVPR